MKYVRGVYDTVLTLPLLIIWTLVGAVLFISAGNPPTVESSNEYIEIYASAESLLGNTRFPQALVFSVTTLLIRYLIRKK